MEGFIMALHKDNILLNQRVASKEEAIRLAGKLLVERGNVEPVYVEKMLEREEITSTFMGNFVAIPHGTDDAKKEVKESGISIIQVPDGVDFGNGNIVKLIFGIAGKGNEHLDILSKIAISVSEMDNVEKLVAATSVESIIELFEGVN